VREENEPRFPPYSIAIENRFVTFFFAFFSFFCRHNVVAIAENCVVVAYQCFGSVVFDADLCGLCEDMGYLYRMNARIREGEEN